VNESSRFDLTGNRVLITGGASGIGASTARVMTSLGAEVVLADVTGAAEVTEALNRSGARVSAVRCDVTDRREVETMLTAVGSIDALVASAAICPWTDWLEQDWDEVFDRVMAVNVRGVINCVRGAMPKMIERRSGRIVLIGSVAGQMGGLNSDVHYVASKGGVLAIVKWLARRGAPHNVLVNGVAPGPVRTAMTETQTFNVAALPMGRIADPEEIAWPLAFLCSPAASYISGAVLGVNGGLFMG
jgi:NAD(P)-dependent dehydrogenase (short-subunit alcohol dehydrogenase family)